MAEPKKASRSEEKQPRLRLNLVGLQPDEDRPSISVTLLGQSGKALTVAQVGADGSLDLAPATLKKAERVLIGPDTQSGEPADPDIVVRYRAREFEQLIQDGVFNLPRGIWGKWRFHLHCVTGTVKHCRRGPWWYEDLFSLATAPQLTSKAARAASSVQLKAASISRIGPARSVAELINFPTRCQPICNGTVEVYRRTCCCEPWIVEDPRLPELIRELEDIVRGLGRVPPIGPPNPPDPAPFVDKVRVGAVPNPNAPDPTPFQAQPFFQQGALDEKTLYAHTDLAALQSLPSAQVAKYVNARPYLICRRYSCSAPVMVAQGAINPDGRFSLCWSDWPRVLARFCHDEYAYIVRQRFGPFQFAVYNGLAANIWFSELDDASLVSYSPLAYACRNNGEPGTGAYVFLDVIGDTESWQLKTPAATGWDRVAAPAYNDGLVFPAAAPADALGANLNRNWGGTLKLNYKFSEDMRTAPVGAIYYRIGITEADSTGAPTAAPNYLSAGLSWEKSVSDGMGGVDIVPVVLGPFSVGTQDNLFKIPYDADGDWNADQYHGFLDTTDARWSNPAARHLVTLEVFDAAGTRLRPTGSPASGATGAETAAPFTFRRRFQDLGPTSPVPFAALTHMFWWDNQALEAVIEYLNKDGGLFNEECLFLLGTAGSTFGIGYRAYHPNELFQLAHAISWQRGVPPVPLHVPNDSVGYLLLGASNNVGQPPAGPGNSPTNTFADMLRTDLEATRKKCAFTVFLSISSKTTDGDYLGNHSITRSAAFALEIA